jgi:cytochrome bd ubiquinol oxidase subunit II
VILADLTAGALVAGVVAYGVMGSADFGAGFWDLTAGGAQRGARIRGMVHRSMAPVWEVNHVWLIFILVIFWTAFPEAFAAVMTTLYVPLFIAGIGLIFRGAAFAVRGEAATIAEHRLIGGTFALSSVLIPFCLGAAAGGVASGRVPKAGNGDAADSWLNATSATVGVLVVATGAYLAAVYLAADSQRAGLPDLVAAFRRRALGAGIVTGALALAGLVIIRDDARALYDGVTGWPGIVFVLASGAAGAATLALAWRGHFGLARLSAAAAVATVAAAWVAAQWPDLLPGQVTVEQAAAHDAVLGALLGALAIGFSVLAPSLVYLFRLVLRGQLDKEYHPMTAGEEGAGP